MAFHRNSKAERRRWWRNLTPAQRHAFVERKMAEKSKRPRPDPIPNAGDDLIVSEVGSADGKVSVVMSRRNSVPACGYGFRLTMEKFDEFEAIGLVKEYWPIIAEKLRLQDCA